MPNYKKRFLPLVVDLMLAINRKLHNLLLDFLKAIVVKVKKTLKDLQLLQCFNQTGKFVPSLSFPSFSSLKSLLPIKSSFSKYGYYFVFAFITFAFLIMYVAEMCLLTVLCVEAADFVLHLIFLIFLLLFYEKCVAKSIQQKRKIKFLSQIFQCFKLRLYSHTQCVRIVF